jgi:T5SS/PEP-CTERM-associated repeat protein
MKSPNQKIKTAILFMFLGSAIHAWSYTNPIDGQTTETVSNLWNLGSERIQVGLTNYSRGNALIIANGGRVISGGGWLGSSGSISNRVTVTGTGSAWINSGEVVLYSSYNELLITDGGRVDSASGMVGQFSGDNRVTVSGTGSIWSNSAALSGGAFSGHSEVIITNGGRLYSNGGSFGYEGAGVSLVVTGPGSIYKNAGGLNLASSELLIADGGKVENTDAGMYWGSAQVTGTGSTWVNSGQLRVESGEFVISDGGRVESNGGQVGGYSTSAATVTGTGSTWNNTGTLEMRDRFGSSVTVSNGGTISTTSLAIEGGTFHLQSGGKLAVSGDFNASQAGTFDFTGGTLSVGGNLTNLFTLATDCRLEAVDISGDLTVHGTFAPGQSPADTMLNGAFVLADDGTVEMELAGYLSGTEYDRLTVTGESKLDGTLAIVLLNDFAPVYGTSFDLFNWDGGVSGNFGATNLPTLGNGLYWDASNLYTTGTVTVVPEPASFMLVGMGGLGVWLVRRWSRVSV